MLQPPARTALTATLVAAVILASCSSGGGDDQVAASTTVAPSSTFSTAPSTTTTEATTATTSSGESLRACPDGEVPATGAGDVTEATADVDGDGADDRLLAYRLDDGSRVIGVDLARGGTASFDLGDSELSGPSPLSVLGAVPLTADTQTILAVTGAGASVVIVRLFKLVGCELVAVTVDNSMLVELPVGGGITHGDGLTCRNQTLIQRSVTSTDGETFDASETTYRLEGTSLVEVASDTSTLTRGEDDDTINGYFSIDCPSLTRSS